MEKSNLAEVKLVVFDWDGTVMDSIGRIVSSMQAAADSTGLAVPSSYAVKQIIGLSLDPAFAVLFPDSNAEQRSQLFGHYRDHYTIYNTTPSPLFAGAEQVLKNLAAQNILLAVATGKARHGLDRMFAETGLGHYFVTSRCADEAQSKPHPDMLVQIGQQLGISPEHAIMVGDTSHDMKMAQAINMPRIGVTHGVHGAEVLRQYQPKAIIDNLPALLAHI